MDFSLKGLAERFLPKTNTNEDPHNCCSCEYGIVKNEEGRIIVFCKKKKRSVKPSAICPAFSYDLLKRAPRRMTMPTLDKSALDD